MTLIELKSKAVDAYLECERIADELEPALIKLDQARMEVALVEIQLLKCK